jgi:DNA invertase Pin-like site-specific DNA recombinase
MGLVGLARVLAQEGARYNIKDVCQDVHGGNPPIGRTNVDIGYARVSTRDQNPQLQLNALEQAGCNAIYEEKVSGAAKKRPVRDQVLLQLKAGDTLTVWKLDRLGRSAVDLLDVVSILERRGVRFRCLTQPIDTSSPTGRLFLTFLAGFAEFERELMRERVRAGKERMKAEGLHPGGPSLFGFEADHKTIIEEQAELLREAARRVLDGEPLSRIVDEWNERGHRPGKATRWRVTHLRRILVNPRTAAILGQETYDELVRLVTGQNRQKLGRPAEHLLSGILVCGRPECGQPLYAATKGGKTGVPQMVYRCKKGTGSGGRFSGCGSTVVSLARADAWAEEAFVTAVVSPDFADSLSRRQAELLARDMTAEQLDDWRIEIAELEQVLPTRFGTTDMKRRHDQLQRMVRDATTRLLQQLELQALLDLPKSEDKLRARWAAWSIAERRTWLRRVVECIAVKPATTRTRASSVEERMDPRWLV